MFSISFLVVASFAEITDNIGMLWFLIWFAVTVSVLTFMGWSTNILLAQRKAWTEFATRYKLEVIRDKGLLAPVFIRGQLQGRRINIYTDMEISDTRRTRHSYTMVEVFFNHLPPAQCILSKKPLPEVFSDMTLPQVLTIPSAEWPQMSVAMTDDTYTLANWLSGNRLKALKGFMDAAGRDDTPMLISDKVEAFLLWRTADPLRDPRQLNALMQKLYGWARELDTPDKPAA